MKASLFFLAGLFIFSNSANAIYLPGNKPLPHTRCYEEDLADAGFEVYITAHEKAGATIIERADVFESWIGGSHHVASRNVQKSIRMGATAYRGHNISLTISIHSQDGKPGQTGRLKLVTNAGEKVTKNLRCEGLMHIMKQTF